MSELLRHDLAEQRLRSSVVLVKALLQNLPELLPEHRNEFLGLALWKVTEAEWPHKYATRYISKAAQAATKDLRHDHVLQRKHMVEALLRPDANVDGILATALGCTVTKDEHTLLNRFKAVDGWDRYRKAGIAVIDRETGESPF